MTRVRMHIDEMPTATVWVVKVTNPAGYVRVELMASGSGFNLWVVPAQRDARRFRNRDAAASAAMSFPSKSGARVVRLVPKKRAKK